jgi:hypothetical protein
MSQTVTSQIVDMAMLAATREEFVAVYPFANGTSVSVARNGLTGRGPAGISTVPINADGTEDWTREESWMTVYEVAERMQTLAE